MIIGKIINWFRVAPQIFIALLVSWVLALVSFLITRDLGPSGALLVGGSIVAETYFSTWKYRTTAMSQELGQKIPGPYPIEWRKTATLGKLSKDEDVLNDEWYAGATAMRVEKKLRLPIVLNAIVGTLVWAYL